MLIFEPSWVFKSNSNSVFASVAIAVYNEKRLKMAFYAFYIYASLALSYWRLYVS